MKDKLKPHQRETIDAVMTLAALGLIPHPLAGAGKTRTVKPSGLVAGGYAGKLPQEPAAVISKGGTKARVIWFECGYWFVGVGQAMSLAKCHGSQYIDNVNDFVTELNRLNNER